MLNPTSEPYSVTRYSQTPRVVHLKTFSINKKIELERTDVTEIPMPDIFENFTLPPNEYHYF